MDHEIDKELLLKHIQKSDLLGREKLYLGGLVQQNGWIPCSEMEPICAGQDVIVCAKNRYGQSNVFIAFKGYGDLRWHTMNTGYMDNSKPGTEVSASWEITHWMPLPEPPGMEGENEQEDHSKVCCH